MTSCGGVLSGGMGVGAWSPVLFEGLRELEGEGELLSWRGHGGDEVSDDLVALFELAERTP